MPSRPPSVPEIDRFLRYQRKVDPRSLDLPYPDKSKRKRGLLPEAMPNPEYWPDDSTTHIFPEERNPTRLQGIQAITDTPGGLGERLQMLRPFDAAQDVPRANPDGSYSTEVTRTVETPDGWAVVPSLWFGGERGPQDFGAWDDDQLSALAQQYEQTSKQRFPRFETLDEANTFTAPRSEAGGAVQSPLGDRLQGGPPPEGPGLGDRLLNQWKASLANRILSAPSKLFGGLVVDPAVEGVTDLVTLAGDVYGGRQPTMSADPQTGEFHTDPRLADRAMNAAGAVTLGAGAIPAAANELRMGIKAYHGSPHDFDAFDSSKIGTGEGAQAYGHGLYFAENEGVARQYRETLGRGDKIRVGGKSLDKSKVDYYDQQALNWIRTAVRERPDNAIDLALEKAARDAARLEAQGATQAAISARKTLERLQGFKAKGVEVENPGRTYEVDIAADPEHFLDWDKPLSEQPKALAAIDKKWGDPEIVLQQLGMDPKTAKGSDFAQALLGIGQTNKVGAATSMREAGIPGIRYLDQGSRGLAMYDVGSPRADFGPYTPFRNRADAEEHLALLKRQGFDDAEIKERAEKQTSNFVVFPGNEHLIAILKKYGLPISAAGLAALSQLHPQEAQAQSLGDRLQQGR